MQRAGSSIEAGSKGKTVTADEKGDIVQIRIALWEIEPPIWRRVQVPAHLSLRRPHDVIQVVMGWLAYHLYQFDAGAKRYGALKIVAANEFGPPTYGNHNTRLTQLIGRGFERFSYTYDFGGDWQHDFVIERTLSAAPGEDYRVLVDGEWHGPPEDCDGRAGFPSSCRCSPIPSTPTTTKFSTGAASRSAPATRSWISSR